MLNDYIVRVGDVSIGNGNFTVMAGSCSVESDEQILDIALSVKKSGATILRGGAFKPRTSPYAFQGKQVEGLEMLQMAKKKTGLPIVSEIMNQTQIDLFEDIDIIQVGARNMQNFDSLKALGGVKKPILFKRGLASTIEELLMSAEYIVASGNNQVILCERGIRSFETMTRNTAADEEPSICGEFTPRFSEDKFVSMVNKVKGHIAEGDIHQAVVSNCFKAPFKGSLMNVYRLLRTINPSPYMVYMRLDDMEIACSSPETLVSLRDGELNSFPLAGTCPRGKSDEEDAAFIEALLKDEKELTEHELLVNLAREDIGRVSRPGSIKVRDYRKIKRFSHVSHISSNVTGELREGVDSLDVIAATLPAGTLSGSPKKRACEIIDELEGVKRGVYGGAIGYIDFIGNMDMCIGIRMAVLKDGHVTLQAGAGIVADSVPEKEYQETRNKAHAVMEALKATERI